MDSQLMYQATIKRILEEYARYTPAHGDIRSRLTFDDEHGSYALFQFGWDGDEYVHGAVIHLELVGQQIWVQYDGTEEGVATDLLEAGVPKEDIVLGFRPPELRPYTEFGGGAAHSDTLFMGRMRGGADIR